MHIGLYLFDIKLVCININRFYYCRILEKGFYIFLLVMFLLEQFNSSQSNIFLLINSNFLDGTSNWSNLIVHTNH